MSVQTILIIQYVESGTTMPISGSGYRNTLRRLEEGNLSTWRSSLAFKPVCLIQKTEMSQDLGDSSHHCGRQLRVKLWLMPH